MNKRPDPELIDDDAPELTEEFFRNARPAKDVLPPKLYAGLVAMNRRAGVRGPQKAPTKVLTTIRLSPEVVEHFKATGAGWQSRLDGVLKEYVAAHAP
ncbi:MAG: BrnA antitoxin family protein [Burkholderiaceae bacterium]|jgi:uncharacterized protein (DUF4415 family)|nr:BrnA antitoxin family protein [Burkholderiaceae bacterium]